MGGHPSAVSRDLECVKSYSHTGHPRAPSNKWEQLAKSRSLYQCVDRANPLLLFKQVAVPRKGCSPGWSKVFQPSGIWGVRNGSQGPLRTG